MQGPNFFLCSTKDIYTGSSLKLLPLEEGQCVSKPGDISWQWCQLMCQSSKQSWQPFLSEVGRKSVHLSEFEPLSVLWVPRERKTSENCLKFRLRIKIHLEKLKAVARSRCFLIPPTYIVYSGGQLQFALHMWASNIHVTMLLM